MYRPFYYQELFSTWNYCKTNEILKDGERLPPQCSIQSWASPLKVQFKHCLLLSQPTSPLTWEKQPRQTECLGPCPRGTDLDGTGSDPAPAAATHLGNKPADTIFVFFPIKSF